MGKIIKVSGPLVVADGMADANIDVYKRQTFTNQATLTYNGQTTTSNVTVGELTETLTAAKTAVVPDVYKRQM